MTNNELEQCVNIFKSGFKTIAGEIAGSNDTDQHVRVIGDVAARVVREIEEVEQRALPPPPPGE